VFVFDQVVVISPDGETLLGRPLTRFEDFVQQHKSTFI
jgi:NAD(P)H dehydrogenase (quinone)